jgi:hypothetical protein
MNKKINLGEVFDYDIGPKNKPIIWQAKFNGTQQEAKDSSEASKEEESLSETDIVNALNDTSRE